MSSFDCKKNIEDSIKDWLIITATTTWIFYVLKAANVKSPKASLDAMDIMKLVAEMVGGVLVKDYAVYKKWIKEWYNKNFYGPLKGNKITQRQMQIHSKGCAAASRSSNSCLCRPTFQLLKYRWDRWQSDGSLHP